MHFILEISVNANKEFEENKWTPPDSGSYDEFRVDD